MKKFTTIKTLLVGLCAMGAMSAWAGNFNATLTHTASSFCSTDANSYTSTVDAAKEHVNNAAFNATWQGAAYAEFAISIPSGESITSATLTFLSYGEKRNERNCDVMVANTGGTLNYTDLSAGTAKVNLAATKITSVNFAKGDGAQRTHEIDVTNAVKSIIEAEQDYIVFKFTGNPGGGDIAGKNTDGEPTLVIVTADASTQTKYTVKFTDGTNDLKDPVVYDGTIGENANASDDDKASFLSADGQKKYIYESGAEAIKLVADASSNVITLTFREASKYSYTLWARFGDNSKQLSLNTGFENDNVTYYYPQFVQDGTTIYVKNRNSSNPFWGGTTTLAGNTSIDVNYSDGTIEDVVFYKEAEEMEGFTAKTTNNATIRCSNGTGGIVTDSENPIVELVTLPAGNYKIVGQVWGTTGLTAGVKANDEDVWTLASTGSLVSSDATFTLDSETTLYVYTTGGNDNHMLDYIYIQKMAAPFSYTVNCVDEDMNLLQDITKTGYEGETLNIAWNKYIKVDGQWYVTEAPYAGAYTEEGAADVIYKKADIYDFIELESTSYKSAGDTNNNENASGGTGVLLASGSAMATKEKIAAGTYDFSVYGFVRRANADELILQISADGSEWTDVTTLTFEDSKAQTQTAYRVVLSEDSFVRFLENKGQNTCHYFDYVVITETPAVAKVEITAAGYATYCSKYALDLDGIEAYTATIDGSSVTFNEQMNTVVAPGTGLLIKAAEGTLEIPVAAEGEVIENNALIGVTEDTAIAPGIFVLLDGEKGIGLYKTHRTFTVKANSAYFAALPSEDEAREFIALNGEATAIKAIETEQNNEVYNLAGQRVKSAQKGLYIIGGKKVIK